MQHELNHLNDNENSCKTFLTDMMTMDTNSTSFHKTISTNNTSSESKKEFDTHSLIRAPEYEEQIYTLKKKGEKEQNTPLKTIEKKDSKNQQPLKIEKSLKETIEKRKIEVKKLLGAQSLRQKFSHLLPDDMKLKIGYFHHKLIQKMCCIDRCITILNKGSSKSLPLKTIQDGIKSMKDTFEQSDLKQIIYLNDNYGQLYYIDWVRKLNSADYELIIRLPFMTVYNESQRKLLFRKIVYKFLMTKYSQYLKENSIPDANFILSPSKWQHGFNVEDVRIPLANIPTHPLEKKLSLSQMDKEALQNVRNKDLKQIIQDVITLNQKQKQKYQQASYKQPTPFKHKLYKIIKSKQEQFQHEKTLNMIQQKSLQTKQLIKFCNLACALFIERKVNTMFLMTFLESMRKRMEIQGPLSQIQQILNSILQLPIKFLIKIQSPKGNMIQIKRQCYNEILNHLQNN